MELVIALVLFIGIVISWLFLPGAPDMQYAIPDAEVVTAGGMQRPF